MNINSPQSCADISLARESEILPVLARWELEGSPLAWPCWHHWVGKLNYHCSKSLCWGEGSEVVEDMGIKDQPPSWSNWKCGSVCVCVCVCVCVWCEGEWIFLWCAWLEQGRYCQTFLFCYATLFLVFWLGGIGFSWEFCVCSGGSVPVSSSGLEASAGPFLRYTEGSEKCR